MIGCWAGAVDSYELALRAAGRSPATVRLRRYQLSRIATAMAPLGPWEVTSAALVEWLGAQDWSAESRRSWRSTVRGFYGWAHGLGLVNPDPSLGVPAVKPAEPCPRPTPEDAYRVALARADDRVRLMLRLAAELGLRRCEVARLHTRDLERDLVGWTLVVHGKGGKLRRVPLSDGLVSVIRRAPAGYLFPGQDNGHLSAHYVGKLVARALPGAWAMHSLRHRFATVAYCHDRDLLTVQELLGHASPVTTRRYVRVPGDALRRTVAAVARV